jgi:beta-ureidopropionase / N-carbamoyl-L-amino-acid hydrolase
MAVLSKIAINGDRLNASITRLAKIGRLPNGNVCRLAFSPEDLQARYLVQQWMVEAGMAVRTDAAGNMIGTYGGKKADAAALATGSHIDTVPSGGEYDGALGVLAGIEVVRVLREQHIQLNHPVEVIVFTDEESSMVGCQAMAGMVKLKEAASSLAERLERVGGNWDEIGTAQRSRGEVAAFVELHVEQGAVLERSQKQIGIVQGVVGMLRQAISITGQANHAGTTPMEGRHDALVAAAEVVLFVKAIALKMPSQPVATVGFLTVAPNAVNIVPGQVELTVDMRDLSQDCLDEMKDLLDRELQAIAARTYTHITTSPILIVEPSPAAASVQQAIEKTAQQMGLSYCHLPSRAGHDALEMGRFTDMGMIFVPSQAGVSHSCEEYTSPEQCIQGANVLLNTLLLLDERYP